MESQPQSPEFRINPENFHTCVYSQSRWLLLQQKVQVGTCASIHDSDSACAFALSDQSSMSTLCVAYDLTFHLGGKLRLIKQCGQSQKDQKLIFKSNYC